VQYSGASSLSSFSSPGSVGGCCSDASHASLGPVDCGVTVFEVDCFGPFDSYSPPLEESVPSLAMTRRVGKSSALAVHD